MTRSNSLSAAEMEVSSAETFEPGTKANPSHEAPDAAFTDDLHTIFCASLTAG
jgi:hypothetical protein